MRTTLDIDEPILKDLKRLRKRRGKTMGRLVSDLLAEAMKRAEETAPPPREFRWHARNMGARLDLADRDAISDAMDKTRGTR